MAPANLLPSGEELGIHTIGGLTEKVPSPSQLNPCQQNINTQKTNTKIQQTFRNTTSRSTFAAGLQITRYPLPLGT